MSLPGAVPGQPGREKGEEGLLWGQKRKGGEWWVPPCLVPLAWAWPQMQGMALVPAPVLLALLLGKAHTAQRESPTSN